MSDADCCTLRAMLEMKKVKLQKTVSRDIALLSEARTLERMGMLEFIEETDEYHLFKPTAFGRESRAKMPRLRG